MRYGSDFPETTDFGDAEPDSDSTLNSDNYYQVIKERLEYVQ